MIGAHSRDFFVPNRGGGTPVFFSALTGVAEQPDNRRTREKIQTDRKCSSLRNYDASGLAAGIWAGRMTLKVAPWPGSE